MVLARWMALGLLLCASGVAAAVPATASTEFGAVGVPLQRRFAPEHTQAAPVHFAVANDAVGRMLFGNIEGLLRYDGEEWELIELPARSPVRALATGPDGRLYLGSYDTFGWLDVDDVGQNQYRELLTASGLRGGDRHVGTVWQVLATPDGLYFRSDAGLHFLDYQHKNAKFWPLPDDMRSVFAVGNDLFARVHGQGFGRITDGKFVLEPGGEQFADLPLPSLIAIDNWRLLVGEDGLYRADGQGIAPLPDGVGRMPEGSLPYTALRLSDGSIAVGTRSGEVLQFGVDFHLRQRLSLGNFAVEALGSDAEGGLWAATEGGLVRMSLPSPWSFLGDEHGLQGNIYDYEWFDGALWLAGSRGIQKLSSSTSKAAEHMPWVDFEGFALRSTPAGLLIAHRDGLLELDAGNPSPHPIIAHDDESIYGLIPSRFEASLTYAFSADFLYLLRLREGQWQVHSKIAIEGISVSGLEETAQGELWLGDSRGGPRRWRLDTRAGKRLEETLFNTSQGLDIDPNAGSSVYQLDQKIRVISGEQGFRFDGNRFVVDAAPPFTLVDRPTELVVEDTPLGTYAYTTRQLWHRPPGASTWQAIYLNPDLAAGYGNVRVNKDGVLRIATWTGLLQYDPKQASADLPSLTLRVDSVIARPVDGSRERFALKVRKGTEPVLVPPGHSIALKFSMVSMESGAQYRYYLHGVTPGWSDWTDRSLQIRALPAGDYLLDVEARARSGRAVPALAFRFRSLPYWYEQWWAWTLGVVLVISAGAGLAYAGVRRRTERFQAANRRLEARIAERTAELEFANRQLSELATEDALTGIANRRALELGLRREWQRCLDQQRTLSALMIDVDHFKKFNDTHGHLEGDRMLKAVARHLRAGHDSSRELLARYGGEEFALLLPGLPLDEAARRGEDLRASLAATIPGLTVSIGVAGFVPSPQWDHDSLLRRADAALYRAKRGGRNRVEADTD